jgi:hypothetical protein
MIIVWLGLSVHGLSTYIKNNTNHKALFEDSIIRHHDRTTAAHCMYDDLTVHIHTYCSTVHTYTIHKGTPYTIHIHTVHTLKLHNVYCIMQHTFKTYINVIFLLACFKLPHGSYRYSEWWVLHFYYCKFFYIYTYRM